jgi:hypothetical protein
MTDRSDNKSKEITKEPITKEPIKAETIESPFTGALAGEYTSELEDPSISSLVKRPRLFGIPGLNKKRTGWILLASFAVGSLLRLAWNQNQDNPDAIRQSWDSIKNSVFNDQQASEESPSENKKSLEDVTPEEKTAVDDVTPKEKTAIEDVTPKVAAEDGIDHQPAPKTAEALEPVPSAITNVTPKEGASMVFDLTKGPATFKWQGEATKIIFSLNKTMKPIARRIDVIGKSSYGFRGIKPATWFWRLDTSLGEGAVQSFKIRRPKARNFEFTQPVTGSSISRQSAPISWKPAKKVAWYKLIVYRKGGKKAILVKGTSGSKLTINNIKPGQYEMKLGAFSEVSGKWEWKRITDITVN